MDESRTDGTGRVRGNTAPRLDVDRLSVELVAARAALDANERELDDELAARKIAGEAADRFRDVLSECLDLDENPGDDALVAIIRERSGKTGPEPTRWRDFCTSARAQIDQIEADRRAALGNQP